MPALARAKCYKCIFGIHQTDNGRIMVNVEFRFAPCINLIICMYPFILVHASILIEWMEVGIGTHCNCSKLKIGSAKYYPYTSTHNRFPCVLCVGLYRYFYTINIMLKTHDVPALRVGYRGSINSWIFFAGAIKSNIESYCLLRGC